MCLSFISLYFPVFPALAEGNDPLGRAPGEALWPERYSRVQLLRKKDSITTYYWRSLYQQDPQAEGGTEWSEGYFKPEIWFNEWPTDECLRVVTLDPSKGKESKFGDYSAFVKVMRAPDGFLYVDAEMGRWNTAEIVERAVDIQRTFRPHAFGIEVNQFQSLLADQINAECNRRGIDMPLMTIENYENKLVRIRTLTPLLAKGRLRFKGDSQGARLLVDQLRDFPLADHDDAPDSLEMNVRVMAHLLRPRDSEPVEEYVYA